MRARIAVVATALMLLPASASLFAQVVDQSNYIADSEFGTFNFWNFQSFTTAASTSVGGGFNVSNISVDFTGSMQMQLWSNIPSSSGATMLASGTTAFSLVGRTNSMVNVFWAAVALTPGAQYYLAGYVAGGFSVASTYGSNPYAGGQAYYNRSTTVTNAPSCCGPNFDLTFQTFSSNTSVVPEPSSVVPEPSSVALVAAGLLGVAGAARRRRKNFA